MTKNDKGSSTELIIKVDNPKNPSADKIKGIYEKIGISKSTGDVLSKIGIYGANYAAYLYGKIAQKTNLIGNAYGVVGYLTLDLLVQNQEQLKGTKFNRLARVGGSLFYLGAGAYSLASALTGDWQGDVASALFDFSMSYQLDKDARELYSKLNSGEKAKSEKNAITDLEEIFIPKKDSAKPQDLERKTSEEKNYFQEIKEYFGEKIQDFKENYKIRAEKAKERKKIEKEEKAKASLVSGGMSLKKKKQFLVHYEEDPDFMKKYEIENKYSELKKKPIDEQMQFMENKKNSLEKNLARIKRASWIKRFSNSVYISEIKSELKELKEILWELDIEKKNPPQRPIDKFL
ncbi:hypothetical protein HYS72_00275 [Candidatus Pacearchaeota archaeon]|nr:hypothetical protein [Candidatus Pacearchaeota archaeon]MBI2056857.1 hypothetical protein [Candidatus Pacearchaeota archaeon]